MQKQLLAMLANHGATRLGSIPQGIAVTMAKTMATQALRHISRAEAIEKVLDRTAYNPDIRAQLGSWHTESQGKGTGWGLAAEGITTALEVYRALDAPMSLALRQWAETPEGSKAISDALFEQEFEK